MKIPFKVVNLLEGWWLTDSLRCNPQFGISDSLNGVRGLRIFESIEELQAATFNMNFNAEFPLVRLEMAIAVY